MDGTARSIPLEEGGSAIERSRHRYKPQVRAVMDLLCACLGGIARCLFQVLFSQITDAN